MSDQNLLRAIRGFAADKSREWDDFMRLATPNHADPSRRRFAAVATKRRRKCRKK